MSLPNNFVDEIHKFLVEPNILRSVLILIASMLVTYWLSRFVARAVIRVAQLVATRGDNSNDEMRMIRYRQVETYLSITVATVRVAVVVVVGYLAWKALSPLASESQALNGLAAIGAGAFFIVLAGQTIGIVLRDITAGTAMIAEDWFHVGDYVVLEPFMSVAGVVERFTLRSTRLRAVNGEIIWINNQNITGAHVVPRGVVAMSVEVFVNDKDRGIAAIQEIIDAMPKGKTMLPKPLQISVVEPWTKDTWHITVDGRTPPQREWLIEEYFFNAVKGLDDHTSDKSKHLLTLPPLVHMSDRTADKRLQRAVRVFSKENHD